MGYDVHITRAEHWLDSKESPIALKEWFEYVAGDPEMELEGVAVGKVKGKAAVTYANKGLAVWKAYSLHDEGGNKVWFDFSDGRIVVKNPDDEILAKMKRIAKKLRANVVGDDGEQY